MATEEYQIGYEEGKQDGFNEAMAQKRTWIGLLDDEKEHIEISGGKADLTLAEKIEAILKERNT